jgi:hypothetical protein
MLIVNRKPKSLASCGHAAMITMMIFGDEDAAMAMAIMPCSDDDRHGDLWR